MRGIEAAQTGQQQRNKELLGGVRYLGEKVHSAVLPLTVDIGNQQALHQEQIDALEGLQIEAAATAIRSLASLAEIGELDHLGGGLELIPSLLLTLAITDYERIEYTIEHAHTSVGYYAALAALGFIDEEIVVGGFRRGLDAPGHVSWLPGGTQLNGGRLGGDDPGGRGPSPRQAGQARRGRLGHLPLWRRWLHLGPSAQRLQRRGCPRSADHFRHAPQRHPAFGRDRGHYG